MEDGEWNMADELWTGGMGPGKSVFLRNEPILVDQPQCIYPAARERVAAANVALFGV
jgi:hypothetical protein